MQDILTVTDLVKTFPISKKQQKIENTTLTTKVAVNNLSFSLKRARCTVCWAPTVPVRLPPCG